MGHEEILIIDAIFQQGRYLIKHDTVDVVVGRPSGA